MPEGRVRVPTRAANADWQRYQNENVLLALALAQQIVHLTVDPSTVIRRFDPSVAFGAGIDGHEKGENAEVFSPASVVAMKSAGFGRFTYRLRTELACEAWHWNPEGAWSEPGRRQGYWTSSAKRGKPIRFSYGYRLPRRGNTTDQANDDGYSRIVDGDAGSFWKSNPYLDPSYGGDAYSKQPQWVVVDLGSIRQVDTARVSWGEPYAKEVRVEFWSGEEDPETDVGEWIPFPGGRKPGSGGEQSLHFGSVDTRWVRLLLVQSSGRAPEGSKDRRDGLGFAIRELAIGRTNREGRFEDWIKHAPNDRQSKAFVSSTDPWHREIDLDTRIEQPGFDIYFKSALVRGKPSLVPVPALYGTPEDAEAEAQWLKSSGYEPSGFEIGEEPDGQLCPPESYAQLYGGVAKRIRKVFPKLPIGGPSFQTITDEFRLYPKDERSWLARFLDSMRRRRALGDFNFCSFEWYPFDDVSADPSRQLPFATTLLGRSVDRLRSAGLKDIPWVISEYGMSAFGGPSEDDLPGAIFNLDCALGSLKLGAASTYLYGLEPNEVVEERPGVWGNNMLFQRNDELVPLPTFYGAWLLNHVLCQPSGEHGLLQVDGQTSQVGCYAVRRPDGRLALALVNRLPSSMSVSLDIGGPAEWRRWSYSPHQYRWLRAKSDSRPALNLPPTESRFSGETILLDGYSINVLVEEVKGEE